VDQQALARPIDLVGFELGGVMTYIIQHLDLLRPKMVAKDCLARWARVWRLANAQLIPQFIAVI